MRPAYTYLIQIANGDPFYLRNVRGLKIRETYPGGFQGATFRLGIRDRRSYQELAPFSRLTIAKGPVVIFDGEIRDVAQTFGPDGAEYAVRAYGHGVILKDNLFGPRIYADSRLDRWQEYTRDNAPGGAYSAEHAPEKFEVRQDATAIRIAAKPSAIFSGATAGTQNWAGVIYALPKVGGNYVSESIKRLTFTAELSFPTGVWACQIFEYDGSSTHVEHLTIATLAEDLDTSETGVDVNDATPFVVGHVILIDSEQMTVTAKSGNTLTVTRAVNGTTAAAHANGAKITVVTGVVAAAAYTYTPTLANCKVIGFALKALADQAVWAGFVNDGEASSTVHSLEYAGKWGPLLNTTPGFAFHHEGGMSTEDVKTPVQTAKDGVPFYGDGTSRNGAAARLRFTGRRVRLHCLAWSPFGDAEYRLWDAAGNLLTSGTLSQNRVGLLTGTVAYTAGSATITGTGTAFTTELAVGDIVSWPDGQGGYATRRVTAIASNTSLTVDATMPYTASGLQVNGWVFQKKVLDIDIAGVAIGPAFAQHLLTIRCLGTGSSSVNPHINIDYIDIGVAGMQPFTDGALYVEVSGVTVRTTTSTVDAALVARDVVALYDDTGYGLSGSTVAINEDGATLPDLAPLVFDDPVSGADVLETVCAAGSSNDLPLAWGVWEDKLLVLEEWDVEGDRGSYFVRPEDCEISHEQTIQEDFALIIAPTYTDAAGDTQIGADVTSAKITDTYLGRKRRAILDTSAQSAAVAAEIATSYLANHDSPSVRTRVVTRLPVRDQGGALIPPDEVRTGRLLQIGGIDDSLQYGANDWRSGRRTMIVGKEWDAESGTLTLDLGEGPDSYERLIAKLAKGRERRA